ncbi:N-acetylmuramoyl-L-alanine amidase family protein [Arcobacter peruensis]|uniref:N-acetylmuramoyl-L-alanine amidase family protein n=1 Tax=Arcobacter peruensis TaxID=2320140 RepID=UPI000F079BAA|nr:N-acetylmuramoyl-L-alanine amidase [Arcobacter peruensis]
MAYLKAVLRKDNASKIEELEKLIILGKKLNKNTTPDVKKLEILRKRDIKTTQKSTSINSNSKYTIKSVYTQNDSIIINFNNKVSKDYIRFFELHQGSIYKDVFDINGNFKDAQPTVLKIKNIKKISIGQFKAKTLRIVLANEKNLKTFYTVKEKQIIINIRDLNNKKQVKKEIKKEIVPVKENQNLNNFIDNDNEIRSINTKDNSIVIEFNKNFSKKDLAYVAYKNNGYYEDVFDLKGKFKYTKPIKLSIDGLRRIIVSSKDKDKTRIRISDKKNLKVYYILNKRKLTIKISGISKSSNNTKKVKTTPYKNFQSKTIVIDAGHGGHDPGAVGSNKKYEKVVTLKVAKYLYTILKQRGHKVYLTRSKDEFIKVGKRTDLALRKNADVFVSIHANSVAKKNASKVSGIETYYLSPAKTERAKRVAAKENKSDIRKMSNSNTQAFLSSLNSPKLRYSRLLSIDVQREMLASVRTKHKVKDKGSRPGPFWVLLDAPQASILVELGYISHPQEGKKLYNSTYQKLLAQGMANGIDAYFEMKSRFD